MAIADAALAAAAPADDELHDGSDSDQGQNVKP